MNDDGVARNAKKRPLEEMTMAELVTAMTSYKGEIDKRVNSATREARAKLITLVGTPDARFIDLKHGPGVRVGGTFEIMEKTTTGLFKGNLFVLNMAHTFHQTLAQLEVCAKTRNVVDCSVRDLAAKWDQVDVIRNEWAEKIKP